ncbi:hypothetical protein Ddye_026875 [Dipteronia dyeriana]|uniref:polynucleotide adenylyltransferase n=1 Tax=Dipteronia dyeriana TaxID=168575 RepID=A0AAD9TN29_9ROSI|nr:hypothetical protein Ddye_026875 [Dipteronia dyeriana]
MEDSQSFLYKTLSPLDLSPLSDDPPPSSPPSPPPHSEPYTVFRNEISLTDLRCASVEIPAVDFFSLDVNSISGVADELKEAAPKTTTPAEPCTPPPMQAEPTMERGWFSGNSRFRSPMLQLHKEIVEFCDFLSPTPEEQAFRNTAVHSVFDVIKYIWPNCKPEVFGSFKTGLYLPTSDIDVVILGSGIKIPQMGLHALSRALSQRGIAKKIQVIAKARVPIVKFIEKRSGIAFDISFDVHNGPKAAEFIQDVLSKWPPLRPLCLILKIFLQQRELNEVYSGGIGSYALLTMLMAVLQSFYDCQASCAEQNLGVLLVHFFDIYGRKLNNNDVGVSCSGAGTFFKKSNKGFTNQGKPFLISIEDPQAPENDIGKNSFNYFQIKSAFVMAFMTLTNPKTILSLGPNRSILGTIIRPDPVLMERKGGSNGEVTFNSLLPGAGEPLQTKYGDQQEILCNWQSNYEEESFPRGDGSAQSSGKKRKDASKEKSRKKKKKKETDELEKQEESGSRKEKGTKKKRWRHNRDHANGYS